MNSSMQDVKMECDAGDVGGIRGGTMLEDLPLKTLMYDVLEHKEAEYVDTLHSKLHAPI